MPDTPELSEAKRALLEKYLRGDLPRTPTPVSTIPQPIEVKPAGPREQVVAIQTSGSKRPFFFLHGQWKGKAFFCFPLARYLGPDQPFYVLEPYTFESLPVPPTFEAIAAAHIKSMRTVQPEGPYLLGGWCNGALMAYEIARQLHAEGQKVDLLVMMNPMPLAPPILTKLSRGAITRFGNLLRIGQEKQLNWFTRLRRRYVYLLDIKEFLNDFVPKYFRRSDGFVPLRKAGQLELERKGDRAGVAFPKFHSFGPTTETLRQDYESVFTWAALDYAPPSLYPGKITFIWGSTDWFHLEPFRRGWREVMKTNQVEIYIIPGNHMSLVTEQLHVFAECLGACLNKAQVGILR